MDIVKFDRWVKCVIKNKARDYFRKQNRYYSRTVLLSDEGWVDKYFVTYVSVNDFPVEIHDGELYESICRLSDKRKKIIMLYYFVGYTDGETGRLMDIPQSTVHYNRIQSLNDMRRIWGNVKSGSY